MNSHLKVIGVVLVSTACAAAVAASASPVGKTRAEVRSELMTALDSGWRPPSGEAINYPGAFPAASARSRQSVRNELMAALDRGVQLPRGEAQPPELFARAESHLSRDEVRQELLAALDSGWHPHAGEADYWRQQHPGPLPGTALPARAFAFR